MKTRQQRLYWLPCPRCKEKTDVKVYEDTTLLFFPLYCPHCRKKMVIHMAMLKIMEAEK